MDETLSLLKLFKDVMGLVRKDKKEEFVKELLDSLGKDVYLADEYAKSNKVDYTTALDCIAEERTLDNFDEYMI
jgi:hypothetical protein